jgi:TolB protein
MPIIAIMKTSFPRLLFPLLLLLSLAPLARAQLSIEITGAGTQRVPLAITPFAGEAATAQALLTVVRADLERSGRIQLIDGGVTPLDSKIDFAEWRSRSADALVTGQIASLSNGGFDTRYRLYDVPKQSLLSADGMAHGNTARQITSAGHRIADAIYEKLTGERGIFSTRIAYVIKAGGSYKLQIADADGSNPQTALASKEPIISPTWSPDGSRIAYVSFEAKKPVVFVHELLTGKRNAVANFKGSNSAPAWSPDGRKLAVVLTKDGGSQLFSINADGSGVSRIASSSGIDTEPQFSPDGQSIYFTSDRGGSPQIYRIPSTGGSAQRITFEGSYNVTPRLSPDGKTMAYIARNGGRFQLAVMDLSTRQTQNLTDSSHDESPSFAPNGRMILYTSQYGGRSVLAVVSTDGKIKQRLSTQAADVREPSWGAFPK